MGLNKAKTVLWDFPFYDYQYISLASDIRLKIIDQPFKPLLLHTRDYVFSSSLASVFKDPRKLYTRFSLFYFHCGVLFENCSGDDKKMFNRDISLFNKHWGMPMFDVNAN